VANSIHWFPDAALSARSAGDELRPAANDNHVVRPTPTLNVPSTLSFEFSSTCAPTPIIHEPLTSPGAAPGCATASPAASAAAPANERTSERQVITARRLRPTVTSKC
jgi:hypothetical protein